MIQRVPRYCAANMSRWAGRFLLEEDKGQWYECYWLKLPSYGLHRVDYGRHDAWCQLVLFWHGRDGLTWFWQPTAEHKP